MNGYPFLVSRLCPLLYEKVPEIITDKSKVWSRDGLDEAVKLFLSEKNTLFDSLTGKLNNMPDLKKSLRSILMEGKIVGYNSDQKNIAQTGMQKVDINGKVLYEAVL